MVIKVHRKGVEKSGEGALTELLGAKMLLNRFVTSKDCEKLGAATIKWLSGELVWDYTYDEVLVVLDGQVEIMDRSDGSVSVGQKGDVLFVSNGTKTIIRSKEGFTAFYVTSPPTA